MNAASVRIIKGAAAVACTVLAGLAGCGRVGGKEMEVDAGGHRVHMKVVGASGPAVVLESGLPGGIKGWEMVQREAGRFARVVAYDRAGSGKSEGGALPRDAKQIAQELHTALRNAGVAPPYLLVGHSMGGPYIRVFAGMYGEEVMGMVLVDPTQADWYQPMEEVKKWFAVHRPEDWPRVEAACEKMPKGLENLHWTFGTTAKGVETFVETLPAGQQEGMRREWWELVERMADKQIPRNLSAGAQAEFEAATDSFKEAMGSELPRVPIILLSAKPSPGLSELEAQLRPNWREFNEESKRRKQAEDQRWVDATPGAKLVIARGSGHGIPEEDPELVVTAIREVVAETAARR